MLPQGITLQALGHTTERRPHQPKIRSVTKPFGAGKSSARAIGELTTPFEVVAQTGEEELSIYIFLKQQLGRGEKGEEAKLQ